MVRFQSEFIIMFINTDYDSNIFLRVCITYIRYVNAKLNRYTYQFTTHEQVCKIVVQIIISEHDVVRIFICLIPDINYFLFV